MVRVDSAAALIGAMPALISMAASNMAASKLAASWGLGAMVMVKVRISFPRQFTALIVNVNVPGAVGAPARTPEPEFKRMPGGNGVVANHWIGCSPDASKRYEK